MDPLEVLANRIRKVKIETIFLLVLLTSGIFLIIYDARPFICSFQKDVNLNNCQSDQINETFRYSGDIGMIVDSFAVKSEYVNSQSGGRYFFQDLLCYYVIPIDDNKFIGLQISKYSSQDYEKIMEETQNYLAGKSDKLDTIPIHFQGVATKMTDDLYDLFCQWFENATSGNTYNLNPSECLVPYCLSIDNFTGSRVLFLSGILIVFIAIFLLILSIIRANKRKKAEFWLSKNGEVYRVQYFSEIEYTINSLDDSDIKSFEVKINPCVAGVSLMRAETEPSGCNYIIEYTLENKGISVIKRIKTSNIKILVEQFKRVYIYGKAPSRFV